MSNAATTYHTVRPVRGSMIHAGYEYPFTRSDGTITTMTGTICNVTVQYRPGCSAELPLAEVAEAVTCPRCIDGTALIISREAELMLVVEDS